MMGYERPVPNWWDTAQGRAAHVAEAEARGGREALAALADEWQWKAWIEVLKPTTGIPAIAHGQQVTDWLRARVGAASDGTDRC